MHIYERIFDLLEQKNMTQKELSEKTGIGQSTISDWKNKKVNPAADKIMIICEAMKISPYELLLGTDEKYMGIDYIVVDKKSNEFMLIDAYRALPVNKKYQLLGYAEALKEQH